MAKRLYRLNNAGRIVLDYDMRIAEPLRVAGEQAGVDMWPVMPAFRGIPTLLLRGARSDLLSEATAWRMLGDIGEGAALVTVPDVGHAPVLDEPEALAGIDALLERVLHG
jgi:pimeloyl-ACP methyl ester carboxylesterase